MNIGIDPGVASFGIAVEHSGELVYSEYWSPRDFGSIKNFVELMIVDMYRDDPIFLSNALGEVTIERFVAYKGIHSDASEKILMLIGALNYKFDTLTGVAPTMVRAIDWKPKVCKYLVRTKGFNNPYPSFDKKFSMLAAEALSGEKIENDHIADAVCLSYLGRIDEYNNRRTG